PSKDAASAPAATTLRAPPMTTAMTPIDATPADEPVSWETRSPSSPLDSSAATTGPPYSDGHTRDFFRDTLAIIMMSPSRYHLAPLLKQHYGRFFERMYFCGPWKDKDPNRTVVELAKT